MVNSATVVSTPVYPALDSPVVPICDRTDSPITSLDKEKSVRSVCNYALQKTDRFFDRYALAGALGHSFLSRLWLAFSRIGLSDALRREISSGNLPSIARLLGMRQYKGEWVIRHYFEFNGESCFAWMYPDVTISVKKLNDGQEYIARTTSIVERESVVEEIRCSSPDVKLDQDGSAIIMYQWMSGGESGPMPFFPEGRRIAFEDIILSPTVSSDRSMISLDTKSFYMRLPTGWLNGTIIRFRKSNDTIRDASPEEENMLTQRSTLMLVTIASSDRPITLVSSTLDAETANSDGPAGVSE